MSLSKKLNRPLRAAEFENDDDDDYADILEGSSPSVLATGDGGAIASSEDEEEEGESEEEEVYISTLQGTYGARTDLTLGRPFRQRPSERTAQQDLLRRPRKSTRCSLEATTESKTKTRPRFDGSAGREVTSASGKIEGVESTEGRERIKLEQESPDNERYQKTAP